MSDEKPPPGLSAEDLALWRAMMGDVEPIDRSRVAKPEDLQKPAPKAGRIRQREVFGVSRDAPRKKAQKLDGDTLARLQSGQIRRQAKLDLHGRTESEAFPLVQGFLTNAYNAGKRCVLIVTGKGQDGQGVLKQNLPRWLETHSDVMASCYAVQKDGGEGARYVYLRRNRGVTPRPG